MSGNVDYAGYAGILREFSCVCKAELGAMC